MPAPLPSIDAWGDLTGKRVFVRVDFNAPVAEVDGVSQVTDDFRLRAALPLFSTLLERGASVVAARTSVDPTVRSTSATAWSRCVDAWANSAPRSN